MSMIEHDLVQGSPEWHAYRASHFNASDAPAMMGVSPYKSRDDLLKEMSTSVTPDVHPVVQSLFDKGHEFEAMARPVAKRVLTTEQQSAAILKVREIVGEDLFPVVGSNGLLSASFDGLNMLGDIAWEHKMLNERIREAFASVPDGFEVQGDCLPMWYQIQMEQQCMVAECEKVLFMATNWAPDGTMLECLWCWYYPNAELANAIRKGWDQFAIDLANYVAGPEVVPVRKGRPPEQLPALSVSVTGAVTSSNLAEFKQIALQVFADINTELKTDEDFADAEATVKWCEGVEERLAAAKENALGQTKTIEEVFRAIDDLIAESKRVRCDLSKKVQTRKDQIRLDIARAAQTELDNLIAAFNEELGHPWIATFKPAFGEAMKGKRTVTTTQSAVNDVLAKAKIEAKERFDCLTANRKMLRDDEKDWIFLFADFATVGTKPPEDFKALKFMRVNQHKQAEQEAEKASQLAAQQAAQAIQQAASPVAQQALAPKPPVISPAPTPAPDDGPATIKLGDICARLGFTMTAAFVENTLGIKPAATDKSAKLYRPSDERRIYEALATHVNALLVAEPA